MLAQTSEETQIMGTDVNKKKKKVLRNYALYGKITVHMVTAITNKKFCISDRCTVLIFF